MDEQNAVVICAHHRGRVERRVVRQLRLPHSKNVAVFADSRLRSRGAFVREFNIVPKLANVGPYRFFFYSNESGEPAHVHVRRERKLAKFWLSAGGARRLEALRSA